jgi:hypothetical protein
MIFDLVSTVELTASAAVVIATVIVLFGHGVRKRALIGGGLAIWFTCVLWAGAAGVLHNDPGFGTKALGAAVAVPVVVLSLIALGTSKYRRRIFDMPLPLLIAVQAPRVLGISFVLLYGAGRLPAPFAPVAGWGDVAIGMTALPMALWSWHAPAKARRVLVAWNALGLADLLIAAFLGATSAPGPIRLYFEPPGSAIMTTLPWILIPCFLVPSYAFLHIITIFRLQHETGPSEQANSGQIPRSGMGCAVTAINEGRHQFER